ncbi:hypothetical protein PMAYCL1PPCAC_10610, partial [Pristionchus mayeri]
NPFPHFSHLNRNFDSSASICVRMWYLRPAGFAYVFPHSLHSTFFLFGSESWSGSLKRFLQRELFPAFFTFEWELS